MTATPSSFRFPLDRQDALAGLTLADSYRESGPLQRVRLIDGSEAWLVTGYEECRSLLAHPNVSSDPTRDGSPQVLGRKTRRTGPGLLIDTDPPEHTRLRRLLVNEFSARRINNLRPDITHTARELIATMTEGKRTADLVSEYALPLTSSMICAILGIPFDDHEFFVPLRIVLVDASATREARDAAHTALHNYLESQVGRKRNGESSDDVIGGLLRGVEEGKLTLEEVTGVSKLLLFTGFETTANMISLSVLALLAHPEQLSLLQEDASLLPGGVNEMLRYFSTAALELSGRSATADINISGCTIREGEGIIIQAWMANHDPKVYEYPSKLDISRDGPKHLAFGHGAHQCLGQNLVRSQMEVAISELFKIIPQLKLAKPPAQIKLKPESAAFGIETLPIEW